MFIMTTALIRQNAGLVDGRMAFLFGCVGGKGNALGGGVITALGGSQ